MEGRAVSGRRMYVLCKRGHVNMGGWEKIAERMKAFWYSDQNVQ